MSRQPIALSDAEVAAVRSWVVHEDAHVLALNKPSGLSSQGGRIKAHTLDTSGVILAAKTKPAAGFLGKALQGRRVRKTYLALVERAPEPREGRIDRPLRREEIGREAYSRVVEPGADGAQASESLFRTLAATDDGALVELRPLTGRMHQLRAHMAAIGRPLVGDVRYGGALTLAGQAAPRLMLHAWRIAAPHPEGGNLTAEAPVPDDMRTLAEAAGLSLPG